MKKKILFITSNDTTPWGGSEVLWVNLVKNLSLKGHKLAFSIKKWSDLPFQIKEISGMATKIDREFKVGLLDRISFKLFEKKKFSNIFEKIHSDSILKFGPDIVVISQGMNFDGLGWMEMCVKHDIPFVTIAQAASETFWPDNITAEKMYNTFPKALLNLFVSIDNKRLTELQAGIVLDNSQVINNPFSVPYDNQISYPGLQDDFYCLACVARLELEAKGQDILFEVLSDPKWKTRNLKINLFGSGRHEQNIIRLKKMFDLDNINLGGYVDPVTIWKSHHGLILPSRHEGLPLALVEAMLCARFGIVSNVSGNPEVIEDEKNGFIASAPKAEYIDQALEKAWTRKEEWESIGRLAKKHIKTKVSADPIEKLANIILALN